MKRLILAVLFLALPLSAAEAQKRCKKGIPCGNTCISATRTCRIGTSSSPAPTLSAPAHGAARQATATSSAPWVGSSRGSTYYRNGCSGARKLSSRNLIYFKDESQAREAGYTRSRQSGC